MERVADHQRVPVRQSSPTAADGREMGASAIRHLGAGPDGVALLVRRADGVLQEMRRLQGVSPERLETIREHLKVASMLQIDGIRSATEDLDAETPTILLSWPAEAPLSQRIEPRPGGFRYAARVIELLGYSIGAAHRMGLVHGALVPSEVGIDERGHPWIELSGTRCRDLVEPLDLACLPPEYAQDAIDADSDVYSLGMLFLLLGLGRAPSAEELSCCRELLGGFEFDLLPSMLDPQRENRPSAAEVVLALRSTSDPGWRQYVADATSTRIDVAVDEDEPCAFGELAAGSSLGRYRLVQRLGQGGMGMVYRAADRATGAAVAIKILKPELARDRQLMHRFRREARTLDEVRSPYVANIVEINSDRGLHYIVMELIEGASVADVLHERGRLPEADALDIIADACRALAGPHRWGLIHRDIKPENMMFVRGDGTRAPGGPRVKVCDFGIARPLEEERETATVHLTQTGSVLGTPLYMAPEQCEGKAVSAATDVYALGISLFALIAGREPFDGATPALVMSQHLYTEPPRLSSVVPGVSAATDELVARALRKDPRDRFYDAAEMLDSVEQSWRGEVSTIELHPRLPRDDEKVREVMLEMDLQASPEDLWPYVCNSERFNRAVGMPPPKYERVALSSSPEDVRTVARNRVAGTELVWRESPFEWVEGKLWGSYREYESGPMRWVIVDTELERRADGGTRVRWRMRYLQSNWFMGILIRLEMRFKQLPALRRVLERIDALLTGKLAKAPEHDAYERSNPRLARGADQRIQAIARELVAADVPGVVVEHLTSFVRAGSDYELARVRPIEFANRFSLSVDATIVAFLQAAKLGLFEIGWDIICPLCRVPSDFQDSLTAISDHANCPTCNADFALDFARSIELVFKVAPSVREVARQRYCVGGPFLFPHVAAQVRLRPGERFALSLRLEPGLHRLRSPQLPHSMELRVRGASKKARLDLELSEHCPRRDDSAQLSVGHQHLVLTNTTERELVVRVERMGQRTDALTAARAASIPLFRQLFPEQVLSAGQLVSLAEMTFVRTELEGGSTLYERLGDGPAFQLILLHLRAIREVCASHGGAILRSTDGGAVARFESMEAAARASLAIHSATGEHPIRVSVHRGATMVTTLDDRLEYFGRTLATLEELVLSTAPGHTSFGPTMLVSDEVRAMIGGASTELLVLEALEPDAAISVRCRE